MFPKHESWGLETGTHHTPSLGGLDKALTHLGTVDVDSEGSCAPHRLICAAAWRSDVTWSSGAHHPG